MGGHRNNTIDEPGMGSGAYYGGNWHEDEEGEEEGELDRLDCESKSVFEAVKDGGISREQTGGGAMAGNARQ